MLKLSDEVRALLLGQACNISVQALQPLGVAGIELAVPESAPDASRQMCAYLWLVFCLTKCGILVVLSCVR